MKEFQGPTDLFGIGIFYSLNKRMDEDPGYREFINSLEMNVALDLGYYPMMIKFEKNTFEITRDMENPDLTLKIDLQNLLDLSEGKSSMLGLFLKRKMKIKPFYKILKAYKIFSTIL